MTDPNLANPQDLVNAALGDNPIVTPTDTPPLSPLPTPAPITPPVVEPIVETPVPVLPPQPEPVIVPTLTQSVTMGDDTPLAFVTPPPQSTQDPVNLPPIVPPEPTPKKSNKTVGVVLGVLLLVMGVVGGLVGYNYYSRPKTTPQIAEVGTTNCGEPNTGTYVCGNSSGCCVIDCPSCLEGATGYASQNPNSDVATMLTNNYGIPADQIANTYNALNNGTALTWVPSGVGGVSGWHWTTCTNAGTGRQGVGCDVERSPKPSDNVRAFHKVCNKTTFACKTVVGAGANECRVDADCNVVTPVLACTGISSAPAVTTPPAIGEKVIFTCAGTITPSSAGTLSYKFRYSIDGGAPVALTNKTTTTAELTIAACGTYSVQCQTCATLNNVLTCNPTWTGATQ